MSSHFPPPPSGDQYLYTSQYGFNHDVPGLDDSVLSYQAPQSQHFCNETELSTQNTQSTNTYAFNTNQNAIYRDVGEPRLHSSQFPSFSSIQPQMPLHVPESLSASQALPGLSNVVSAQTNGLKMQPTHHDITPTVASNAVSVRNAEQVGSDLEEGELSEGTDHASPNVPIPSRPASHNKASMRFNGTSVKETAGIPRKDTLRMASRSERTVQGNNTSRRSPASGVDGHEYRQQNRGVMCATRQEVNGRAKLDWAGRDRTPPPQLHRTDSLKVSREAARHAIKQLWPHNIEYLQLLKEHVDSELLRRIYAELQITVLESSNMREYPVNTEAQRGSVMAPTNSKNKTNSIQGNSNPHPDTRFTAVDSVSHHAAKPQEWQQKASKGNQEAEREATAAAKGINQEFYGASRSDHNISLNVITDKAVVVDSTPMRIETDASGKPVETVSTSQVIKPLPTISSDKSTATMSVTEQNTKPSAPTSIMENKSPAFKPAPKPIDRKEYIARLLAAKAGKTLPTTNASKPLSDPVPPKVPLAPSEGIQREKPVSDKPNLDPISSISTPKKDEEPTDTAANSAVQKSIAAEAKKREQTELARRKIEELKKRSEALKKNPSTKEAAQQSPLVQTSTIAPSEKVMMESARLLPLHSSSQNSYFPLHNATFTIPGLFMTSQQSQPDLPREPVIAAPIPEKDPQADTLIPTKCTDSSADTLPRQPVPMKTPASPDKEREVAGSDSISQATISKTVSNLRKRPTAADFLEPIPSKSRRLGNPKPDDKVVFEVSDDEADEPDQNITGMQLNGDQGMVVDQVGRSPIPPSGSHVQKGHSQQLALTGAPGVSELSKSTASLPLQSLPAPPKLKESGGLRSKEEEIARMNRKIAEMEQRRKSKQVASRVPTPGLSTNTTSSINLATDNANVASMPSGIRRFSEPNTQMEEGKRILEDVQASESTIQNDSLIKHRMQSIERTDDNADTAVTIIDEQQRRKAEIESRLPSMSATVEEFMARLQRLQQEEADLQAQIQKQIDDKRILQSELDSILQGLAPVAESATNDKADTLEPEVNVASQAPGK